MTAASTDMDEKLRDEILKSLMWDYSIPITELSKLIHGTIQEAGGMTRELFFLRCLERVPWHNLVPLWHGTKNFIDLYTPKVRRGLRTDELRQHFDFIFGLLRGERVQAPEWGSPYCEKLKRTFLSDRWKRS